MQKTRGKRYSAAEREAILQSYKRSNLGITQWCKANGYNKGTIRTWLRRYENTQNTQHQTNEPQTPASGFVAVNIESTPPASSLQNITIQYPNSVQVKVDGTVDVDLLQQLISLPMDV